MMHHIAFGLLAAAGALLLPTVAADCDRDTLLAFVDSYVYAQENGELGDLLNIAENFTYVENNQTAEINQGILLTALTVEHRRTIVDVLDCATFTELVILQNKAGEDDPHVIGTQIRHTQDGEASVYLIDSIVSTTGHWLFNATNTLYWTEREAWDPIPEDARDSREFIKAAADAYLSMWDNATAADAVPWGTPCARLEGGAYTGNGGPNDSCKLGIPSNHNQAPNSNRRYVIDESMGSISVLCVFEHLRNAPDSHQFRLENGVVRYIHTMTLADSSIPIPPALRIRGTNPVFA